jgi:uncharacterized repeat protein (TIGR01451 family)
VKDNIYIPSTRTLKGLLFLLVLAVALGLGMSFSTPAHGAPLRQADSGKMTGIVTVRSGAASGVSVELRQRTNSGADTSIATTTTDASGTYTFANTPSAPSDAFYYIRFSGGAGMLATWYTFPIIYVNGSEFTVPSVELGDVQLSRPLADQPLSLPGQLAWNSRSSGETYRLFIYAQGKTDKPVLDSGSLGTGTSYDISEGGLPDGKYEGIVQVRDAVAGYGQSQNRFRFAVGSASINTPPTVAPTDPVSVATTAPTSAPLIEGDKPDVRVKLSADKIAVEKGSRLVYRIEVQNLGAAPAEDVVLTNLLPDSVTISSAQAKTSIGSVGVEGNNVTAHLGVLAPDTKAVIEIPVSVDPDAGSNVSNQASITYEGASDPVRSNAYIAQVTESLTGQGPTGTPEPTAQAEPTTITAQPTTQQPTASVRPTTQPAVKPVATPTKPQSTTMPQTGGAFPIVFAIVLVVITLLARYLRGRSYRRV